MFGKGAVRQHAPDAVWHTAMARFHVQGNGQSRAAACGSGCRGTGAEPRPVFGYFWAGQKYRPAQRSYAKEQGVEPVPVSRLWCVGEKITIIYLSTPPFFEKKGAVDGTKETLRGTGPPAPPVRCSGGLRSP